MQKRWIAIGITIAAASIGTWLVMVATHAGPGLSPDSCDYVEGARSLASGSGFKTFGGDLALVPETHFAPLFSVCLAGLLRAGGDIEQSGRWLNAIAFFVNAILIALLISRCADGKRKWVALAWGGALAGLSPVMIHVHAMFWSEPLFMSFFLIGVLCLGGYVDRGRPWMLFTAALAAAAALMTRYSGFAFILAAVVALVERGPSHRSIFQRLRDASVFIAVSCLPMALWMVRNTLARGRPTDRSIAFHPPDAQQLLNVIVTLSGWMLPPSERAEQVQHWNSLGIAGAALAAIIACLTLLTAWRFRKTSGEDAASRGTLHVLIWFAPLYVLFIVFSITFFDASTQLDFRILFPLYSVLLIVNAGILVRLFPTADMAPTGFRLLSRCAAIGMILFTAAEAGRALQWSTAMRWHGLGYYSHPWRHSDLLEFARSLPPGAFIYSNAPDVLYLRADHPARPIPKVFLPSSLQSSSQYSPAAAEMQKLLRKKHGYLFFFHNVSRAYLASEKRLRDELSLKIAYTGRDGTAYSLYDSAAFLRVSTRPVTPLDEDP